MAKTQSGKKSGAAKAAGKSSKAAAAGGSKKMKMKEVPKLSVTGALPEYPIICSECYEDFAFFPARAAEHIECPVCAHMGALPDETTLAKMTQYIKNQKQKYIVASILGAATFLLAFIWVASVSTDSTEVVDPGSTPLILGGLAGVLLVLTMIFAWGSEKNRWDFYF